MFQSIKKLYGRQSFFPGGIGVFVNPFFFARKNLVEAISDSSIELTGQLLDVGCGVKPYRELFKVDSYIGLDIDSPDAHARGAADCFYDGKTFPFESGSFDAALCNQVLEHVFNPEEFISEIHRVMKPGGKLLITVPFVWDEHEQPYDYARYSSFGLNALLEGAGFSIVQHKKLGADATILFQLANAYLYKITRAWPIVLRLGFCVTVMASINLLGLVAGKVLPKNPDLFLDHLVLAQKKNESI